jgi:hypothetical protein
MGSLGTWISTAYDGGAGGSALGFNPDTGLTRAPTVGTPRDITETQVRTIASDVWKEGGDPSLFVSMPDVKNAFAQYLSLAYVSGYRVEPLAKTGPQEDRQMMVDATLVVHTEKAHGMISDVKLQPAVTP